MARPSVLIVGRATAGKDLGWIATWRSENYPGVFFAGSAAEVTDGRLATSDVVIFFGHGRDRGGWTLGGDSQAIFRWNDHPGRMAAKLIVFATCGASVLIDNALCRMDGGHVAYPWVEGKDGTVDDRATLSEWQIAIDLFLKALRDEQTDRDSVAELWKASWRDAYDTVYGPASERAGKDRKRFQMRVSPDDGPAQ